MYHFDWIQRHAECTPDKLALVDAHNGLQLTYAQFNERANRLASYFVQQLQLQPGDRVSLLAGNSADYYVVLMACSKMGAILNTLNWRLTVPELSYILNDCQPRLLIYESEFAAAVSVLRNEIGCEYYLAMANQGAPIADDLVYTAALAAGDPAGVPAPRLRYDDIWAILYTSGTTGRPKGAQVTYGNFFYNAVGIGQALDLTSQDVNLNALPTFHAGGLGLYAGPTFHAGGTVVVMRAFDAATLLRLIETWRVTVLLIVPSIYLMLAQLAEFDQYDLSSVRSWASGGSPLPPSLVAQFAARDIVIQQGFGMTEAGPSVFLIDRAHALKKAGSVGKPVMHTDVRIVDYDGTVLGPNQVGELCIRGGNVTSGYWRKPEATAEALRDGWLHSGDAALFDADGFYTIVDRWKDMFISGGENVYPAEVENIIYQLPSVAEVAVVGIPHTKWQEVGCAVVVVKPGQQLSAEEVIGYCQGKLARYKIPQSVVFVAALPRNAAGKVLKRELRTSLAL